MGITSWTRSPFISSSASPNAVPAWIPLAGWLGEFQVTHYNGPEKAAPGRKIDVKDWKWIADPLHGQFKRTLLSARVNSLH